MAVQQLEPRSSIEKLPLITDADLESLMPAKEAQRQSWWSRQSLLRKALVIGGAATVAIGLSVGLGVGLNIGRNNDNEDDHLNELKTRIASASAQATTLTQYCQDGNCLGTAGVWQPAVGAKWQIVLSNAIDLPTTADAIDPDADVFDIDLFDNNKKTIQTLHLLGKKVICYFSAGSYEPYRPDSSDFKDSDLGKGLDGWPGEKWLDLNSANVRSIMAARIQLASDKGCDAIDPDNVDGYQNNNGLGLTKQDSIDYMGFLSNKAHALNMAIGLKNAGGIIGDVLDKVEFSVNEQCVEYSECEQFAKFTNNDKPVFHIEYPDHPRNVPDNVRERICSVKGAAKGSGKFSTVLKDYDLDGFVEYCDGKTAVTPTKKG